MNRRTVLVRASCAWLIVLISLLVAPVAGQARVSGGCTATATASRSGAIDLTTATVWHVKDADGINGSGKAPTAQKAAQLKVLMLGIGLPVLERQGAILDRAILLGLLLPAGGALVGLIVPGMFRRPRVAAGP